jgi:hypothetical protein
MEGTAMRRSWRMAVALGFFLIAQAAQAQWTPAKRITWGTADSQDPVIAVDASGNLHVLYHRTPEYSTDIYYVKSTDGGATWTSSKRVSWSNLDVECQSFCIDTSGNLHVVWWDMRNTMYGDMYYRRTVNQGTVWLTGEKLDRGMMGVNTPHIAVDSSNNLHVVYALYPIPDIGEGDIYYQKSTNGGVTWKTKRLSWTTGYSFDARLAVDSLDNLHLVWVEGTPGSFYVHYKKSTDGGATWTAMRRIGWDWTCDDELHIAVDPSDNIYLVWNFSTEGQGGLVCRKSTDLGATWSKGQFLTATPKPPLMGANIAIDPSGKVHMVWRDNIPWFSEIYYMKSMDGGVTWTSNKRLSWTSGLSYYPDIAADPWGNLHLVWSDDTPGVNQIYYKKFIK